MQSKSEALAINAKNVELKLGKVGTGKIKAIRTDRKSAEPIVVDGIIIKVTDFIYLGRNQNPYIQEIGNRSVNKIQQNQRGICSTTSTKHLAVQQLSHKIKTGHFKTNVLNVLLYGA